jgi:hypothetical protein
MKANLDSAGAEPAKGHAPEAVFGAVKLAETDVERDHGGDEAKSTTSIAQAKQGFVS